MIAMTLPPDGPDPRPSPEARRALDESRRDVARTERLRDRADAVNLQIRARLASNHFVQLAEDVFDAAARRSGE